MTGRKSNRGNPGGAAAKSLPTGAGRGFNCSIPVNFISTEPAVFESLNPVAGRMGGSGSM
jgi:hypothetical protein